MTELLFHQDSYLRETKAKVVAIRDAAVILERTIFYPGGGGQPQDEGKLLWSGFVARVQKLKKVGDDVYHWLSGPLPRPGQFVKCKIDWQRRYQLMRTHTAMHILCGVIWRDYQAQVTGGDMQPLKARMDFELAALDRDRLQEIECAVNREVEAARPVRVQTLPREEAFQIPDLIRTKINLLPPNIQQVRTVEIVGLDLQADGGTHVANTSEVGRIEITGYENKGKINKRLRVEIH